MPVRMWLAAITASVVCGALEARASTSSYPFTYGFPSPPPTSYNPHLYWNYATVGGRNLDQRTLKRWQGHVPWGMVNAYLNDPLPVVPNIPEPQTAGTGGLGAH